LGDGTRKVRANPCDPQGAEAIVPLCATDRETELKVEVWVLCTVLTDENAPAMPAVFADAAAARVAYDQALRAEWNSCMDGTDDGPYFGDRDAAQDRMEPPFAPFATRHVWCARKSPAAAGLNWSLLQLTRDRKQSPQALP
jgi:hypothetical protein